MCDYSLENVASRPAQVADRLVVTAFPNTITRGFAAQGDVNTAVCLRPGTELAFEGPVEYEHSVTYARAHTASTVARFRQVDTDVALMHHDALEFASGEVVVLARLIAGQQAMVLQMPADPMVERPAASRSEMPLRASELLT